MARSIGAPDELGGRSMERAWPIGPQANRRPAAMTGACIIGTIGRLLRGYGGIKSQGQSPHNDRLHRWSDPLHSWNSPQIVSSLGATSNISRYHSTAGAAGTKSRGCV